MVRGQVFDVGGAPASCYTGEGSPGVVWCLPCARNGNTSPLSLQAGSLVERQATRIAVMAENGMCALSRGYWLAEMQTVTTLLEIGFYHVSRTIKHFIADSSVHEEHGFKRRKRYRLRDLRNVSTKCKMLPFAWILIQTYWL